MTRPLIRWARLFPERLFSRLPAEERQDARFAKDGLGALSRHIERITHALQLMDYCDANLVRLRSNVRDLREQRRCAGIDALRDRTFDERVDETEESITLYSNWRRFAARDIVITIEDFYRSLTDAKSLVQRCPTLRARILKPLDEARTKFVEEYPMHLELRNAACHLVDYASKANRRDRTEMPRVAT